MKPSSVSWEVKNRIVLNRPGWFFVISVQRLLQQKQECLNTRLTCTVWHAPSCRAQSVTKALKPSVLFRSTQQHFIGTLFATSVLRNLDQAGHWGNIKRGDTCRSISNPSKLLAAPWEKTQVSNCMIIWIILYLTALSGCFYTWHLYLNI